MSLQDDFPRHYDGLGNLRIEFSDWTAVYNEGFDGICDLFLSTNSNTVPNNFIMKTANSKPPNVSASSHAFREFDA